MTKLLLVESAILISPQGSTLNESTGGRGYIVEAERSKHGLMRVKLPATTLDQKNENGRTYAKSVMESAMKRTAPQFESRELLSSVNEHPEEPYVTPGQASHIVTKSWCENDGYMWNEWEVLNTASGKDLQALIEAGASFGVSIRGLGSVDAYNNIMEDYEYLGTDCVGQPSAKIRTAPQAVSESSVARTQPTPAKENTSQHQGSMAMKTKDQAAKYVREQIILMGSEPKLDAMRRLIAVESTLAESSVPARDLVEAYRELDTYKDTLAGAPAKPLTEAATGDAKDKQIAALQAQIKEMNKNFRGKIVEMADKFKAAQTALKESVEATTAKYEFALKGAKVNRAKFEAAVKIAAGDRKKLESASKALKMSEGARRKLRTENVNLLTKFQAARDLAVESTIEANVAVKEAARAVVESRRRGRTLKQVTESGIRAQLGARPTGLRALRQNVAEARAGGGVVSTRTKSTKMVSESHKPERHETSANRSGTTRIPGFI